MKHFADDGANLGRLFAAQTEGHVLVHGQVREQGMILEDHPHAASLGRDEDGVRGDNPVVQVNTAKIGPLQSGDQAQGGGFAAPAWADQGQDFALTQFKGDIVHSRL